MHINSTQYKLWVIVTNGDIPITRTEAEWKEVDLPIIDLNTKAHYTLASALSNNEYNKMYRLKKTK